MWLSSHPISLPPIAGFCSLIHPKNRGNIWNHLAGSLQAVCWCFHCFCVSVYFWFKTSAHKVDIQWMPFWGCRLEKCHVFRAPKDMCRTVMCARELSIPRKTTSINVVALRKSLSSLGRGGQRQAGQFLCLGGRCKSESPHCLPFVSLCRSCNVNGPLFWPTPVGLLGVLN